MRASLRFFVIFSFWILFYLGFFSHLKFLTAQGNENLEVTINYICLKKIYCDPGKEESASCSKKSGHRVRLMTDPQKKFPPNKEVYIAECIYYSENNHPVGVCTTGSDNLDQKIFGDKNFSLLSNKVNYSLSKDENYGIFKIENNQAVKINPQPFVTNNVGETPILEWQSHTPQSYERKWYGFFVNKPQEEPQTGQGGLQQQKANFPPFQDRDCAAISWDPAGRVFDAENLEPIPSAQVTLLKKYDNQFSDARRTELTISNPYVTLEDGGFSFFVTNGEYKLVVSHPNYISMVLSLEEIHPNYQLIYLNPRYGKKDEPKTLIYPAQTGEIIMVNNRMEFRDIPLKPKKNVNNTYPLTVYSFNQQLNKVNQKIVFSGRASHPFTRVILYKKTIFDVEGKEVNETLGSYLSDYFGKFSFSIPLSTLKENQFIVDAKFEKSDLRNLSSDRQTLLEKLNLKSLSAKIFRKVIAQDKDVFNLKLNPIPSQLEGFLYDDKNQPLSNKKVGIYLTFSNIPYYVTTTDQQGFFKIPSTKLPNEPYEIRYQEEDKKTIKVQTSEFLVQNASYLIKNKVNLNQVNNREEFNNLKKDEVKLSPNLKPTKIEKESMINSSKLKSQSQKSPYQTSNSSNNSLINNNNPILLTALILLVLLIFVSLLLFFYYRKNRLQV